MEQKLNSSKKVAIVGMGPAGCICCKILLDNGIIPTVFDKGEFLRTILPTGGTRCNLGNAIYDFKQLVQNYPRGEKFLYSIFSKFSTQDTIDFFSSIGIETYTQDDNRIFPVSNSSKAVRETILRAINSSKFIKEEVTNIHKKQNGKFNLRTKKYNYEFDYVVIAIGGHSKWKILTDLGINIITPTQALVGLRTKENFSQLTGISLKNVEINLLKKQYQGDLLFTHKGVSGPVIYKISSIFARTNFPYNLSIKIYPEFDIQQQLNKNPHKNIKNFLAYYIPKSVAEFVLQKLSINTDIKCSDINANLRNDILKVLNSFEVTIIGKNSDGEVVTCGGVDLKEISSKTLEHKSIENLYFCGEVLDIDGFCGGFNLQNCWSTGFVCANSILEK